MRYPRSYPTWSFVIAFVGFACSVAASSADEFQDTVRPLLREYCVACHSTKDQQGELDLEQFISIALVKSNTGVWEHVREQLANNEMPPKDAKPLSSEQRGVLVRWTQRTLDEVALASAGDPGPVAVRRLSNMEYTYTIRDLTGVSSLDPAAEFPVDGAAGEGFTNASSALVMSPSLVTKYLDAAKEVANHAVFLPSGLRFSPSTSSRDWTQETLTQIRDLYAKYTVNDGATAVDLQGIKFDTNAGGRLPVERYITVLVQERENLLSGNTDLSIVSTSTGLNEKYLRLLWQMLGTDTESPEVSPLLSSIRRAFDESASEDASQVVDGITAWQKSLWRFTSVGHIGKLNGPTAWQEAATPLVPKQELRLPLALPRDGDDVVVYLEVTDAADGNEGDVAVWENLRLVAPGQPDLSIREMRSYLSRMAKRKELVISSAVECLAAAASAQAATERTDVAKLAKEFDVDPQLLAGWLNYLGIGSAGDASLGPLLVDQLKSTPDYNFVQGWRGADALSVVANSSDTDVRIPGYMKAHGVGTHPSPSQSVVVAWRSPVTGELQIDGVVRHAHPDCGNGVAWSLEVRRGHTRERLASGNSFATAEPMGRFENVKVRPGDIVAVVISPRESNHSCDFTMLDLHLNDGTQEWDLAKDVSPNILAGNPHMDSFGNPDVWHFASEPATLEVAPSIPAESLLATWRAEPDDSQRQPIAMRVQELLRSGMEAEPADSPNRDLYKQLMSPSGPLLSTRVSSEVADEVADVDTARDDDLSMYGLAVELFGRHPNAADSIDPASLCVQAPSLVELRIPASLAEGAQLVATARLHDASADGSVQMRLLASRPDPATPRLHADSLVIVNESSSANVRFEESFAEFRNAFPVALCYTKIVPVDEVVTLTLYYREDEHLKRLMLDERDSVKLDELWSELFFVSQAPLKQVDAFEQLYQFATQDSEPSAFEPLREPILAGARRFRDLMASSEPIHVKAAIEFAKLAWRRPLRDDEQESFRLLYQELRRQDLPHDSAVRTLLVRSLVSPDFLYRGEKPAAGEQAMPIGDHDLAVRLSYFLWSSSPDDKLRESASSGRLHESDELRSQTRRMLEHANVRRLATEFGCQWLHVRDLETLDEKSERHFPTFVSLRSDMQEETVRYFVDLFQNDRSILSLIDSDHTFVNEALAKHYDLDLTPAGWKNVDGWQRVDGMKAKGRGGMLGFASTLSKQSGASRTSPILRGNWLSELVLGERLPSPPKDVPILPEEKPDGLTERQMIERHSSDAACAKCHERIDPFGFALEGFDAIGRSRDVDAAGLAIDTATRLPDGTELSGADGLRRYLMESRRDDFLRQFCRKLLGFALGRSIQLSDNPLIDSMLTELSGNDCRVSAAIEKIVLSPQFRQVRGRDFVDPSRDQE